MMKSPSGLTLVTTLLLVVAALFHSPVARAATRCKCISSDPCWPSPANFSQLASQVSRPLVYPVPPASACYPPFNSSYGNCVQTQFHLRDSPWRINIPGAMIWTNHESYTFDNGSIDACYYNLLLGVPCHQGNVAVIGVDARTVYDIQAAVAFSAAFNLRLVIKNTGHDYLGRSMARGAFMLWTHNLKNITYDDAFLPQGAPVNASTFKALTVGAGVQWNEAYEAADSRGRAIAGGSCPSIGAAGGWVLGGGISFLSSSFGLGVDNVIQFTVVLANASYVTVNQYQYQDLFWALRGGGGGTFGVVVSVTYQTYDIQHSTAISLNMIYPSPTIAQHVTTELVRIMPTLRNASWGGRYFFLPNSSSSFHFASDTVLAQGNATFNSFVQSAISAGAIVMTSRTTAPSFYAVSSPILRSDNAVSGRIELISRLLSISIAQENPAQAAKVILGMPHGVALWNHVGGLNIDPDSVGLNPAWRQALGVLLSMITWQEGASTAEINSLRQGAATDLESLNTISPNNATYFNEASLYEKNWQNTFFGSHYARLKEIKGVYDPSDLFLVVEGVGSEDWDTSLNCRSS